MESPTLTEGLRINPGLNVSYQLVFSSILLLLPTSLPSSDPPVVRILKASVGLVRWRVGCELETCLEDGFGAQPPGQWYSGPKGLCLYYKALEM